MRHDVMNMTDDPLTLEFRCASLARRLLDIRFQPFQEALRPRGDRSLILRAQSESMTHAVVDMQFRLSSRAPHCEIEFGKTLGDRRLVLRAADEKCARRLRREREARRNGRIQERLKTRPRALPRDRIRRACRA